MVHVTPKYKALSIMARTGVGLLNMISPMDVTDETRDLHENLEVIRDVIFPKGFNHKEMSVGELEALGFTIWDDEVPLKDQIYLIPIWVYPIIPDGFLFYDIFGKTAIKGETDIDMDTRFGCLSYGIKMVTRDE